MITRKELINWLESLEPGACVAIDEGGLTLREVDGDAYIEIGGEPSEGDDE